MEAIFQWIKIRNINLEQQITDALKNLEEAFVNFHIMLKTNTGGSDTQKS